MQNPLDFFENFVSAGAGAMFDTINLPALPNVNVGDFPQADKDGEFAGLIKSSYSLWNAFRNCRRAAYYRYVENLEKDESRSEALRFGDIIHKCLFVWHETGRLDLVTEYIDKTVSHSEDNNTWHHATAIMTCYANHYAGESFHIIEAEKEFAAHIRHPVTGAFNRHFYLAGKVDGVLELDGLFYLLEHKTSSQEAFTSAYLDKLWADFQIMLYSYFLGEAMGIEISGVFYNVLVKRRFAKHTGWTEEEYEEKLAEAKAKNKSGKSSLKRKMPETDLEFQTRLIEEYSQAGIFERQRITFTKAEIDEVRLELWELTEQFMDSKARGMFYRNTSMCFHWNRACEFLDLCRSSGDNTIKQTYYKPRKPESTDESVF